MPAHVSFSCLRFLVFGAILWFSAPLLAADRNLTEMEELTYHNACERLLDADLSGYYVATNVATKYSQLIQLRRRGHTSAYTVSTAKMDLPSTGIRELQFERTAAGWRIGDPGNTEASVNILTIIRDQTHVYFSFENVNDPLGFTYDANPVRDANAIRGDILRPDEWVVNFTTGFDAEYRFTRVKLDRSFEMMVSQSLKSLLATRLEPGSSGISDYLVTVQLKTPLLRDEAVEALGTSLIYPMDDGAGVNSSGPFYRYAVPKHIHELLEAVGHWTRRWEVAHIDAMPFKMVNVDLLRDIVNHVNLNTRGFNVEARLAEQRTPAMAAQTAQRSLTGPPRPPTEPPNRELAQLSSLVGGTIFDADSERPASAAATPEAGAKENGNGSKKK